MRRYGRTAEERYGLAAQERHLKKIRERPAVNLSRLELITIVANGIFFTLRDKFKLTLYMFHDHKSAAYSALQHAGRYVNEQDLARPPGKDVNVSSHIKFMKLFKEVVFYLTDSPKSFEEFLNSEENRKDRTEYDYPFNWMTDEERQK